MRMHVFAARNPSCDHPSCDHHPRKIPHRFQKELKKRKIPLDEYATSDVNGLRYYDLIEGQGKAVEKGDRVLVRRLMSAKQCDNVVSPLLCRFAFQVHFDCLYKSLDVVSTRAARLLAGNRVVAEVWVDVSSICTVGFFHIYSIYAPMQMHLSENIHIFTNINHTQPFSFVAGASVDLKAMRSNPEIAGTLVTGLGGPQAPPALSTAVIGMKKGGKVLTFFCTAVRFFLCNAHVPAPPFDYNYPRHNSPTQRSVIVPPEVGYGNEGLMEIPPNATIELQIELLEVA